MNKFALVAASALAVVISVPADAAYTFTFAQVGSDVVVTGTGSFKTAGFGALIDREASAAFVAPAGNTVLLGAGQSFNYYAVAFSGVVGSWAQTDYEVIDGVGTGVPVYLNTISLVTGQRNDGAIGVPVGYVSGSTLTANATFANRTLAGLGLRTGTYFYSYGMGATLDTVNVVIPTVPVPPVNAAVPEPATWAMMLLGFGTVGYGMRSRRRISVAYA